MRRITVLVTAGLLVAGAGVTVAATGSGGTGGSTRTATATAHDVAVQGAVRLGAGTGLYPRVVRLGHSGSANGRLVASVVTFDGSDGIGAIYGSADSGKTFTRIGTIADTAAAGDKGLCCGTLYELPRAVGSNPAGTLLWAASFGGRVTSGRRMRLRVWRSLDHGRTWSYLSTPATAGNTGGLWEPEFTVAKNGALVVFYSDETDAKHSQKVVERYSKDGKKWSAAHNLVALTAKADRPGMPVVRRLPNGHYVMSFEVCGGSYGCQVRLRTSADGWSWGTATSTGTRPAVGGRYFAHAPTIAVRPDGSLLLVGQMLVTSGKATTGNGITLFVGAKGGSGTWRAVTAPVAVPDARNDYCPNYSSALLPAATGTSVLEIATDYAGTVCTPYFATAPTG